MSKRDAKVAREIANEIADLLQQEYKRHNGEWWLWALGEPQRPLSDAEEYEARRRGQLMEASDDSL